MSRARTRPIAHIVVTAVARVQSVSAASTARIWVGISESPQRGVEIGGTVKHTALPDPGVDRDPVHFAHWGPGIGGVTHPTVGRCQLGGDVRFGSKADMTCRDHDVRYSPKSGH
jgi:hypothetical protein